MKISNSRTPEEQLATLAAASLPYSFEDNLKILTEQSRELWKEVADLKASYCPSNLAQASVTMHPAFASKKYFPEQFLEFANFEVVGVRPVEVYPRISLFNEDAEDAEQTISIIVLAKRQEFQSLAGRLEELKFEGIVAHQLLTVESIESVSIYDRLDLPNDYGGPSFLVGVYETPDMSPEESLQSFKKYVASCDFVTHPTFWIRKDGIFYVLIRGQRYNLDSIADYSLVANIRVPKSV